MQIFETTLDAHVHYNLIGYARVSTSDQNPQLQIDALTRAGAKTIYQETASGGSMQKREQLHAMLRELRPGDVVVVWKLDRLSRSLLDLMNIVSLFHKRGARFVSLTEAVNTTGPMGEFTLQLLGAFAQFERALIRERTHAGLARARAQGRIGGRKPIYSEEQIRRAMWHLEQDGWSWAQAAGHVRTTAKAGGRAISVPNLQKRVRELKARGIEGVPNEPEQ